MFIAETVEKELSLSGDAASSLLKDSALNTGSFSPFHLSEGENGTTSAQHCGPRPLLLIDEPTYGTDRESKALLQTT